MEFPNGIKSEYIGWFNGIPVKSDKSISVIIPVRGNQFKNQLNICIQSLIKCNNLNYEIIVVEEDLQPRYDSLNQPNISYNFIQSDLPFNKSKCFNRGVSISKFDTICGLDCDMITPTNFLLNGIITLNGYDASFIADDICYTDEYPKNNMVFRWNKKTWKQKNNWQFHGGCFFIKKPAYFNIGGFDEGYIGYGSEDSDFYVRVHKKLSVCPKKGLPLLHMKHDSPHAINWIKNQTRYLRSRNREINEWIGEVKRSNKYLNDSSEIS